MTTPFRSTRPLATSLVLLVLLAGCASQAPAPPAKPAALTTATPQQMVAAIRATAGDGTGELAVQPLRDPMVEDLRQTAQRAESAGDIKASAAALDEALAIVATDPALLQERAEAAILLQDYTGAATFAEKAYAIGAQVGPLCRRHWATLEQARLATGDADGAASAKRQIDGCKIAGPNRF